MQNISFDCKRVQDRLFAPQDAILEVKNGLRVNSSGIAVVTEGLNWIEVVDGGIELVEAGGTRTASGEGGEIEGR